MKRAPIYRKIFASTALALIVAGVFVLLAGMLHYGSAEALWLRGQTFLAEYRPHPQYVPPPFDTRAPAKIASISASDAVPGDGGAPLSATPEAIAAEPVATLAPFEDAPATATGQAPAPASSVALTPTSSSTATPAASPTPAYRPAAPQVQLTGLQHYWQTWNNCGPATMAAYLSYYGSKLSQADIARVLRPAPDDKNVNPEEMVAYVRSQGYQASARVNGDPARLRLLVSNGIPVLIETWLEPKPNDGMGHYRLVTGYDDAARAWTVYDSYVSTGVDPKGPYRGIRMSYDEFDPLWAVFNRVYIVVYTQKNAAQVHDIIGADFDDAVMWERALQRHQAEAAQSPKDAFAYFNLGSDLVALGRYNEAAAAYDQARVIGLPWRMLWYQFGPFRAYYETGRYDEIVRLADATQQTAGNQIEELFYWKGQALKASGDRPGARAALQSALKLNPHYADAAGALAQLGQ